jgi:hypothetical protein
MPIEKYIKHCLDFSFVFSAPLRAWRNLISASGSSAVEGTSQPVTISKKWKIPALLYVGKGPEYRPFHDFRPVPSAYRPRAQISNHYSGPSPIHKWAPKVPTSPTHSLLLRHGKNFHQFKTSLNLNLETVKCSGARTNRTVWLGRTVAFGLLKLFLGTFSSNYVLLSSTRLPVETWIVCTVSWGSPPVLVGHLLLAGYQPGHKTRVLGALVVKHEPMKKCTLPYLDGPFISDMHAMPVLQRVLCFAKCQDALVGRTSTITNQCRASRFRVIS